MTINLDATLRPAPARQHRLCSLLAWANRLAAVTAAVTAALGWLSAAPLPAADLYWSGTGTWNTTNVNWGTTSGGPYTAATWSNATPDSAIFEGTAGTVTLGAPITGGGVTFAVGGYTVTGNTLTLSGTAPAVSVTTGTATIASTVAGSTGLTKNGAGTLTLSGDRTFSGTATVSAGTLRITTTGSLGNSVTINGGTLEIAGSGANRLSNTLPITVNAGGTLLAASTGENAHTLGPLTLNGGTLASSGQDSTFGNFVLGNATVAGSSRSTINANSIAKRNDFPNLTFDVADATSGTDLLVSSVIRNLGTDPNFISRILKSGAGTMELTGNSTYTGGTIINGGVLKLGASGSFANSPTIVVGDAGSSGAVLDLSDKTSFAIGVSQTLMGSGTVLLGPSTTLTIDGTFSPGNSPGLFTYDGGGTANLAGTTLMEIWGTSRATGSHGDGFYDAVNIQNATTLNLGGILELNFDQTFADNTTFELFSTFDTSSLGSNFSSVSVTGNSTAYTDLTFSYDSGNSTWNTNVGANNQSMTFNITTGVLSVIPVPEPAGVALAGIGVGLAGWLAARRRRAAS